MKKIIDGKRYDTDTAEAVHDWANNYSHNDFNWCEETLYRTKKGNWFIYGAGGAFSSYHECYGNSQKGGADLRPLSSVEAQEWLESHGGEEGLERYFADKIADA